MLVALTLVAGVILWEFHITTPAAYPSVSFIIRSGGSNPVWGDPTDCQPSGYSLSGYPLSTSALGTWDSKWDTQCDGTPTPTSPLTGNFSTLNSSQIIISAFSPGYISLSDIEFTFICNNASNAGGTTILVQGTLGSMSWFPKYTSEPSSGAPTLGYCGSFDAGGYGGGAYSTYYNRLGLFIPLNEGETGLAVGDTFVLYVHNGGWPIDFACILEAAGEGFGSDCHQSSYSASNALPQVDYDDYHGAPPWCFQSLGACTIVLSYIGTPSTVLATIPVYALAPPTGA